MSKATGEYLITREKNIYEVVHAPANGKPLL